MSKRSESRFRGLSVKGLIYVLTNPRLFHRLVMRQTKYKLRYQSKQIWTEWQKYDAIDHVYMVRKYASLTLKLNQARMKVISEIFKDMGSGLNVLDVGCGDGALGEHVAKIGNHVVAMDLPEVVILSKGNPSLSLMAGDAEQLAFVPESFDAVIALDVLDHLWKPQSFLDEAYRILKPEMPLIIAVPEGERGLDYDSHKNFFTVEILNRMCDNKFVIRQVKRVQPLGTPTPMIILLLCKTVPKQQ